MSDQEYDVVVVGGRVAVLHLNFSTTVVLLMEWRRRVG